MSQLKWALVFIPVALLTFVGGYLYLGANGQDQGQATAVPKTPATKDEDQTAPANDPAKGPPEDEAKLANTEVKPPPPQRDLFLQRLSVPRESSSEHDDSLFLDATGTRLVAVSQTATWCFDLTSGKVLQTYRINWVPTPARPQFTVASPDGRFVVVPSADGKELQLREAATAHLLGTYRVSDNPKTFKYLLQSRLPAFTPADDFLLVGAGVVNPTTLHAISTSSGTEKLVDAPRVDLSKKDFEYFVPVPQWSTFLVCGGHRVDKENPSNLFAVDYSTGKETPLTCLRVTLHLTGTRPLVLSPDGNLLLVKGIPTLEICDWRNNQLLFRHHENQYSYVAACFTPDGKRVVAIRRPNGIVKKIINWQTGTTTTERIPDEVQLFDIASQQKIASFTPHANDLDWTASALSFSNDGKSFALWSGKDIVIVDFQAAFGESPLPPGRRLQGPETLPLKALTEAKETPRKPK